MLADIWVCHHSLSGVAPPTNNLAPASRLYSLPLPFGLSKPLPPFNPSMGVVGRTQVPTSLGCRGPGRSRLCAGGLPPQTTSWRSDDTMCRPPPACTTGCAMSRKAGAQPGALDILILYCQWWEPSSLSSVSRRAAGRGLEDHQTRAKWSDSTTRLVIYVAPPLQVTIPPLPP